MGIFRDSITEEHTTHETIKIIGKKGKKSSPVKPMVRQRVTRTFDRPQRLVLSKASRTFEAISFALSREFSSRPALRVGGWEGRQFLYWDYTGPSSARGTFFSVEVIFLKYGPLFPSSLRLSLVTFSLPISQPRGTKGLASQPFPPSTREGCTRTRRRFVCPPLNTVLFII